MKKVIYIVLAIGLLAVGNMVFGWTIQTDNPYVLIELGSNATYTDRIITIPNCVNQLQETFPEWTGMSCVIYEGLTATDTGAGGLTWLSPSCGGSSCSNIDSLEEFCSTTDEGILTFSTSSQTYYTNFVCSSTYMGYTTYGCDDSGCETESNYPCSYWDTPYSCCMEGGVGSECTENCTWSYFFDECFNSNDVLTGGSDNIFMFDEIDVIPDYPIPCEMNYVATDTTMDFTASGRITNPEYDDWGNYSTLYIEQVEICLMNEATDTDRCTIIDTNIGTGTMTYYSTSVSEDWPDNNAYQIYYIITGYYEDTGKGYEVYYYPFGCEFTAIGSEVCIDCGLYDPCYGIYDQCIEDASGTFTDILLCRIEGIGLALICPDPRVLARTKGVLGELKQKVPFNYIIETQSFFKDLASNTEGTSTATGTYISENPFENASGSAIMSSFTPLSVIRTLCLAVLIFFYGLFLVRFGSKIFK